MIRRLMSVKQQRSWRDISRRESHQCLVLGTYIFAIVIRGWFDFEADSVTIRAQLVNAEII
jgi:hypothetical protein